MDKSLRNGLMGGFISMFFLCILYISNKQALFGAVAQTSLLIIIGTMLYTAYSARSKGQVNTLSDLTKEKTYNSNEFIGFHELLKQLFKCFAVAYIIKSIFIVVLFRLVDPSLLEMANDMTIQYFIEHKPAEMTDQIFQNQLAQMRKQDFGPGFDFYNLTGHMVYFAIGFILSLIFAQIFRREAPSWEENTTSN